MGIALLKTIFTFYFLLQIIGCYIKNKKYTWDELLQQFAGAIRATQHRQTGFAATIMMLGREVNQPIYILLGTASLNNTAG